MSSAVAIIPARGGSKRIPRKNIKDFLGKPIIAYSIDVAVNSRLFDEVMVSTDDAEIAELAIRLGAKVPFMRSETTSNDVATTFAALEEVLSKYHTLGKDFQFGCCIYPTAPLITIEALKKGKEMLQAQDADTAFPILPFSYPVQRSLKLTEGGNVVMNWPEHIDSKSQDLTRLYHDAGQWYWFNVDRLLAQKKLFTDHSVAIVLDDMEAQDIDNVNDWKLAELKYKLAYEA